MTCKMDRQTWMEDDRPMNLIDRGIIGLAPALRLALGLSHTLRANQFHAWWPHHGSVSLSIHPSILRLHPSSSLLSLCIQLLYPVVLLMHRDRPQDRVLGHRTASSVLLSSLIWLWPPQSPCQLMPTHAMHCHSSCTKHCLPLHKSLKSWFILLFCQSFSYIFKTGNEKLRSALVNGTYNEFD